MTRSIDLQDNFSKTKLIERLAEIQRQQALQQQVANAKTDEEKASEKAKTPQDPEENHQVKPDGERRKKFIRKKAGAKTDKKAAEQEVDDDESQPETSHEIDLKA